MKSLLKLSIIEWNSNKNQRTKLQQAYLIITFIVATAAGLLTLLSVDLGKTLVTVAAIFLAAFVVNAVSWALIDAFVIAKVNKLSRSKSKK
ncbi:hypothetical protein CR969_00920 [Candidatus Saccharibacteria bacterium]|nr:MAG: hypothetical protein CR969_00920 [Candidatus Saccharibacteria bacterium]